LIKTFKLKFIKALLPLTVIATLIGSLLVNTHGASFPLILKAGLITNLNGYDVNVYSSASQDSSVLTTLSAGTYVTLRSNASNGWYYVMYGDELYGYIMSSSVNETQSEVKQVKGDTNVRLGPSINYKAVGVLSKDEIFLSLGQLTNGWYRILFEGINVCYISNVYVDSTTNVTSQNTTSANTTAVNTTSANTTSVNTTSADTTTINTTSADTTTINTTSADTTAVNTTSVNITSVDTTAVNTTSADTTSTATQEILPQSISSIISYDMKPDYSLTLPINITPTDATNKTVTLVSNNTAVASIEGGDVHANSIGTAIITITTVNGLSTTCIIRVSDDGGESLTPSNKAVRRAYDYLDLFGVNSNNPAIPNNDMLRVYLDQAYTDNKRYTNCAEFVWYCYRAAGMYLEDKTTQVAVVETMVQNPGSSFINLGALNLQDLKPGDVITWLNYYSVGMGHAAVYVGDNSVIDMSPGGIQKRSLDLVNSGSYSGEVYNIIRCIK